MTLENQVCSLEIAKKLKELNVKQESLFYYERSAGEGDWELLPDMDFPFWITDEGPNVHYLNCGSLKHHSSELLDEKDVVSAYTVAELFAALPARMLVARQRRGRFSCYDGNTKGRVGRFSPQSADTAADAMGKMLIYLIENGILDPKSL